MNKILFTITEGLLLLLRKRGVDITQLRPVTNKEKKIEKLANDLYDLQATISIKRAEIVQIQNDLIVNIEPIIFDILSKTDDNWQKTTVTKLWLDKLHVINSKVGEHEKLLESFEMVYYNLENEKKSL